MGDKPLLQVFIMKDKKVRILSTRPLDEALVDEALQHQITIDSISFIQTEDITDVSISIQIKKLAKKLIAVVFTSRNGVEAVIKNLREDNLQPPWKIYCIGAATQSSIKDYFISANILATGRNAAELSEAIINDKVKEVVFFCGDQRRDELPQQLQKSNIEVEEIVVYKTNEIPVKVDKEYNGILFFSPSAVKSFFSVNSIHTDTVLFSIGDTTADEIRKNCNNKTIISDFPSKDKLVGEVIKYFNSE